MSIFAIIPARYNSERLPGKPLADIGGVPMIRFVWEAAVGADSIDRVIIATDDPRIELAAKNFGAEVIMTSEKCVSGTNRAAEVIRQIYPSERPDIALNIQGDEPLLTPEILNKFVAEFQKSGEDIGTIVAPAEREEMDDPNTVKVVCDSRGNALYFSRSPIPHSRDIESPDRAGAIYLKHIGIYAFKAHALLEFDRLEQTPLEKIEKLEQLRALENGMAIRCITIEEASRLIGVDTPRDLERVISLLRSAV